MKSEKQRTGFITPSVPFAERRKIYMNINGNSIFMGAYEERRRQEYQLNPKTLDVSEEKQTEITSKLKEAMKGIDRGNSQSAKVSISQEDIDFLCSEEGFEKMKKDAADLYLKNADSQKK